MFVPIDIHPYTYLSPEEAKHPLAALIQSCQDDDLFEDRKTLLQVFQTHAAHSEEETEGLSKVDQADLCRRLCKMLEAAHQLATVSSNGTQSARPPLRQKITLPNHWTNMPAFLQQGDLEDPIGALVDICAQETLHDRRIVADQIFQEFILSKKWQSDDPEDNQKDQQYFNSTRALWELAYQFTLLLQSGQLTFQRNTMQA